SSSDSRCLVARRARLGVAVAPALSSSFAFALAFDFDRCAGTPVGLTSFGLPDSGATGVSAARQPRARITVMNQEKWRRSFMGGGKLAIKLQRTQARQFTNRRHAESVRFGNLPGRR